MQTKTEATINVRLPRLVGAREAVVPLLDRAGAPATLEGKTLRLACRDLASASASFSDELVKVVLRDRRAERLLVVSPPEGFRRYLASAASKYGVEDGLGVGND